MDTVKDTQKIGDCPLNLREKARSSKHGRWILKAWHYYGLWGNKSQVARKIREEAAENDGVPPTAQTVERWLKSGDDWLLENAEVAIEGAGKALTEKEASHLLADMARNPDAKVGERVGAIRTELDRTGKMAPKRIEIRGTMEILDRQPLSVLEATQAELLEQLAELSDGNEVWQPELLIDEGQYDADNESALGESASDTLSDDAASNASQPDE